MICREEIVEIGRYNKAHGVNGEISATMQCDADISKSFSCYISCIDGIFVPFFSEGVREKNSQTLLLKIEGIDSESDTKTLVNKEIYVLKSEFAKLSEENDCDEAPVDYFLGFTIIDSTDKSKVGEVVDIDDSTENVLFIVEDANGEEIMIPAAEDLVTDIDFDQKVLSMMIPEGLIENK